MFDLPVITKQQRRSANQYRKFLLNIGFDPVQLSVYCKYLVNATGAIRILEEVKATVPFEGEVRVIRLTDTQWSTQSRFFGPNNTAVERQPQVLEIFETWSEPGDQ